MGNGVSICGERKKGLMRVREVKIKFGEFDKDEIGNVEELGDYVEKDLSEGCVCN